LDRLNIIIRTAGGSGYGAGHISRMSILANALFAAFDCDIHVLLAGPDEVLDWFADDRLQLHHLGPSADLSGERHQLGQLRPDLVVIDLLHIEAEHLRLYKNSGAPVVLFSDMGDLHTDCDLLVLPQQLTPLPAQQTGNTSQLVGPDYFMLAADYAACAAQPKSIKPVAQNLLISLGGEARADSLRRMRQVVDIVAPSLHQISWVLGRCSPDLAASLSEAADNVEVIEFVGNMPERMQRADMAILAGGFVKYEVASCGLPAIIVAQYQHQTVLGREFAAQGAAEYLGELDRLDVQDIADQVLALQHDSERRERLSQAGQQLVDGKGVERVLAAIRQLLNRETH
jgi:spore coat polysaccharide biosynthesis predicted glycosyltransferase SpsG